MLRVFGFDGKVPSLPTGVKPKYTDGYAIAYDPADVPAMYAGPNRAHILHAPDIEACCSCMPGTYPVRPFAHWVWLCESSEWVLHPSQSLWKYRPVSTFGEVGAPLLLDCEYTYGKFYGYQCKENAGFPGPSEIPSVYRHELPRPGYPSFFWELYREWVNSGDSRADKWLCGFSASTRGTMTRWSKDAYGLISGYLMYEAMYIDAGVPEGDEIVADIIYEGNWTAAGKAFFSVTDLDTDCDIQIGLSSHIHAVTVGSVITDGNRLLSSADLPAPPPDPPQEWQDFFCDCENSDGPPDQPSPPTPPPPDTPDPYDCQEYFVFDWDCVKEEWVFDSAGVKPKTMPAGTVFRVGLQKTILGEVVDCEASPGEPPDPGVVAPPQSVLDEFCPVPSECPCDETFPPASWPCGGLLEVYSATYEFEQNHPMGGPTFRLQGGNTKTLTANSTCGWSATATLEIRYNDGSWNVFAACILGCSLDYHFADRAWRASLVIPGSTAARKYKLYGRNPSGAYTTEPAALDLVKVTIG